MRVDLGFKPFDKFWLNCFFNSNLSILSSLDSSYLNAAYLNAYHYQIKEIESPNKNKINYLFLDPYREFYYGYYNKFLSYKGYFFKDKQNFIEQLRELICQKKVISIGVDLFYWIPDSICWQKHHWEHFSLINGYDSGEQAFYVLDENIAGYACFKIPEERLINAVQSFPSVPDGLLFTISDKIFPFELTKKDIIFFSNLICNNIKSLDIESLWHISEKDTREGHMFDLFAMFIFQIVNRHKGNAYLFKTLYEIKFIKEEILLILLNFSRFLQQEWTVVKNRIVKSYFSRKQLALCDLYQKCNTLFTKENDMWELLISNM